MRWDLSELPKGMTQQKLRIAHLLGTGCFEQVSAPCVFTTRACRQNMPCISVAPFKLADKDIQASFYLRIEPGQSRLLTERHGRLRISSTGSAGARR